MKNSKLKLLIASGIISVTTLTANAGGIHCDDDPKCLPCIPGAVCHNSSPAATNRSENAQNLENLEITSKLDGHLAILLLQAEQRNDDLDSIPVNVSIRLSGPVSNVNDRELLGLVLGQNRRVLFLSVTLGMLNEIEEIPEVLIINASSRLGTN